MRQYRSNIIPLRRPRPGARFNNYVLRLYMGMYVAAALADVQRVPLPPRFTRLYSWIKRRYRLSEC